MAKKKRQPKPTKAQKAALTDLRKAVANFNKKITRYSKTDIAPYLPERQSMREIKSMKPTAAEMKTLTKQLQRFTKMKGKPQIYTNPKGVSMTEWERRIFNERIEAENRKRKKRQKMHEMLRTFDEYGREIPDTKKVVGESEQAPIKSRAETVRPDAWKEFAKSMERQMFATTYEERRAEIMKQNMITALEKHWGNEGKRFINALELMTPLQVHDTYLKNMDTFTPENLYKLKNLQGESDIQNIQEYKDLDRILFSKNRVDNYLDVLLNQDFELKNKKDRDTMRMIKNSLNEKSAEDIKNDFTLYFDAFTQNDDVNDLFNELADLKLL